MDKKKVFAFLNKYFVIEAAVFALLLILDLVSKHLIDQNMTLGQTVTVIPYLFNFYYTHNTGAAFGLFKDAQVFFIVITFLALAAFGFALYKFRKGSRLMKISIVLIMAGALGNLVDRLAFQYVRDFIQFAFWQEFAIFNFADAELVIGVVLFAVYLIFFYKEPKKSFVPERVGAEEAEKKPAEEAQPDPAGGEESGPDDHGTV